MKLSELIDALSRLNKTIPAASGGAEREAGLSVDAILAAVLKSCVERGALDPES